MEMPAGQASLQGVITDTHFVKRDRMGRLLLFLARILQAGWGKRPRAIALEENAAVLIGADGSAIVVGLRPLIFLRRTPPGWLQGHRLEERAFAEGRGPNPATKDDTAALVETEVIVDPLQ